MIELGKVQKLVVIREVSIGVYLNTEENPSEEAVLLPRRQVPEDIKVGDEIQVFIYRDSEDRLVATTRTPYITLGEFALLKVIEITEIGAFLNWGLEKDLLLPYKEQILTVKEREEYLVSLYIDKTDRLCATMRIHSLLSDDSPYKVDDRVEGTIYSVKEGIGIFVAVDNMYDGMIPAREMFGELKRGDKINARVTNVKEDGKLDLSMREKAYIQMDIDSEAILKALNENDGELSLNDKSSPDEIKIRMNMSKNAFKRAVGRLLKGKRITITENGIKLI
ncbi:CvfB family protein [Clostridium sp. DL1XJH146]